MKTLFSAIVLTAGLAGAATSAQAQKSVSFGPRVGVNLSNIVLTGTDTGDVKPKSIFGAQVGVTADIQFGSFAFQPSLLFTQKGFKVTESGSESFGGVTATYSSERTLHINYVEMPLNFVYTTGGDHGFQVLAGPYLALGVGGNSPYKTDVVIPGYLDEHESGTGSIKFSDREPDNSNSGSNNNDITLRRFDGGVNLGVGYRQGPVQVQVAYAFGFGNIIPLDSDGKESGYKAQNRVFQVSANYFFGAK
ncbi:porin family protein [Hymenobacter glaciei]|uniref:Porin family protein n=1 Tax=Hymenobacter glaciei TaxID=877209 RepID=A0ABP7UGF7_9BACT